MIHHSKQFWILIAGLGLLGIALWQTNEASDTIPPGVSPSASSFSWQNTPQTAQVNVEFTNGVQELNRYLNRHPDDTDHWIQLGNLLFDNGNFADAVKPYTEALRLQPENPDVRTDLGVCLFNTGMNDEAILQFERALQYAPDHITATFNLGIVHARMGRTQSAVQYWRKTIRLGPDTDMGKKATRALTDAGYKP